jgi:uncharacterized iron-regulated membrane protein
MRRILFWLHLVAGVVAGAIILVMSVTGVLLTYERQLTAWADGHRVASSPAVARLPVEALAARVREARGTAPSAITLRADPTEPAAFAFGREATVFVDPYSGAVLGEGSRRARVFFRMVTDWHRWLGASGERRPLARAVTGAANLAFLFIVLSGVCLWWPRGWTTRHLRPVTLFQGGLEGRARDFNWHNVFGFWSALPLAFVVASAVFISYPWASDLPYRLTGSEPPRRGAGGGGGPQPGAVGATRGGNGTGRPEASLAGLDRAWASADAQVPGWQTLSLRLPATPEAPWVFSVDTSAGARRPDTRTQLTVDRRSGEVVKVEGYAGQPAGRKIVGWLRFIHTGEAFGATGQTVAGLASAGGALLVWTGLSLALRRLSAWRRRRSDAAVAAPVDEAAA